MTTPSVTGTPQAFDFADGNAGHLITYTGGGTADASTYDVLCVNSDTVVSTPSGWTLEVSAVANQGSYVFTKNGGTSSATVTTSGNFNTNALWVRITGSAGSDTTARASAQSNSNITSSTPSVTTAALASSTELVLAFAALHGLASGSPSTYVWSSGYNEQVNGIIGGSTSAGATGSVAVKAPAGTAAESPSVSWTTPTSDQYMLVVPFTAGTGSSTLAPTGIAVSAALGTPTVANGMDTVAPTGIAVTKNLGVPTVVNGMDAVTLTGIAVSKALGVPTVVNGMDAITLTGLAGSVALGQPTVSQSLGGSVSPAGISIPIALGAPIVAGQPYVPTVTQGSWYGLISVLQEARAQAALDEAQQWVACPNDGEPLSLSVDGIKYCRWDNWQPPGQARRR